MENAKSTQLQRLMDERRQLLTEMEALRNKIAGLEIGIKVVAEDSPASAPPVEGKVHVSETIVSLLRESGANGIKPKAAIALAAERGISLNRGSVYALLNRMERAGKVVHEDARYKLKEFAGHDDDNGGR